MILYTPDHLEAIVTTYNEWSHGPDSRNPKTALFICLTIALLSFTPTFGVVPFYDSEEVEGRRLFKPFFDINPVLDMTNEHPYE
jgi:hypothetical protein